SGEPNQTITLPNGTGQVVINEQKNPGPGDITVNALHVTVTGIADVIISSAHADITCPGPPTCPSGDFVTGGGWITASGGKADNGEPGRADTFTLTLSTGYTASGKLGGGNIQLHNPCP